MTELIQTFPAKSRSRAARDVV